MHIWRQKAPSVLRDKLAQLGPRSLQKSQLVAQLLLKSSLRNEKIKGAIQGHIMRMGKARAESTFGKSVGSQVGKTIFIQRSEEGSVKYRKTATLNKSNSHLTLRRLNQKQGGLPSGKKEFSLPLLWRARRKQKCAVQPKLLQLIFKQKKGQLSDMLCQQQRMKMLTCQQAFKWGRSHSLTLHGLSKRRNFYF